MSLGKNARIAQQPPARRSAWRLWLVAKDGTCSVETLTVECGGHEALAVFSHEEEAELFLYLGKIGDGWRVRESSAGEVVSLLFGPYAGVGSVALDPSPLMAPEMINLVRVGRDRFVNLIAVPGEERTITMTKRTRISGQQNRLLIENSNRRPRPSPSAGSTLLSSGTKVCLALQDSETKPAIDRERSRLDTPQDARMADAVRE
jgi:hypothetical protein